MLILSGMAACAAMVIGLTCTNGEPGYTAGIPAPDDTVAAFFDAIAEERYEAACALLKDCSDLGLRSEPDDRYAAVLWRLVRSNTSWQLVSGCTAKGKHAAATVELRYPDLEKLMAGMTADVNRRVAERIDPSLPPELYYDENGEYLPELIADIYSEVFGERVMAEDLPMHAERVSVALEYENFAWRILAEKDLLAALSGLAS